MQEPPQLLGILASLGDTWMVADWLWRHAALFERLVVVDGSSGSRHAMVQELCAQYANIVVLKQTNVELSTDQRARGQAMTVIGKPRGRWIMLAHTDEFWLQDPRHLVSLIQATEPNTTVILAAPIYVIPTSEEWRAISRGAFYVGTPSSPRFHAANGRLLAVGDKATVAFHPIEQLQHGDRSYPTIAHANSKESRLFLWHDGCRYGTRHRCVPRPRFL